MLFALLAFAAAVGYASNPVTQGAQDYARGVAAASGGLYLTLRSLNAFLSTAQELQVSGGVLVEGSVQPLKVLEPVDDTIERIADVVFFILLVTGIVGLSMGPVSAIGFGLLGLTALLTLLPRAPDGQRFAMVRLVGFYGFILALALPVSFLVASLLADWMTASVWAQHDAILADISATVAPEIQEKGPDGWRELLASVERYGVLATTIYDRADELVASFVAILSVLFIKVLILPLAILGAITLLARNLARS
jgi:hypothetical protein